MVRERNGKRDRRGGDHRNDGSCGSEDPVRELNGYRETLEWLMAATRGRGWLSTAEIARVLGIDRDTVVRRFGVRRGCALPVLAKRMAEESR